MTHDDTVKLATLSIDEVSGVDHGANLLDGWMVQKAANRGLALGPDQVWDVGAADKRIRKAAGAVDAPNAEYARCFLHKSGDGARFGDYKFLVCDHVDGEVKVMPSAVRAAADRLSGSSLSDVEKTSVQAKIDALTELGHTKSEVTPEEATSLMRKLRDVFLGERLPNDEGADNVTPEELTKAVGDAIAPLTDKVEALEKSAAEAAEVAKVETTVETTETSAPDADAIAKAIEDGLTEALKPYNEILEKVLDRVEGVEKAYGIRKSLDGQESAEALETEGESTTKSVTPVAGAIAKALRNPSSGRADA